MNNKIIENLRIFRQMYGLSQSYVAMKLGLSTAGYGLIESGETMLNPKKLPIICQIIGIEEDTLRTFDKNSYLTKHKINV